MTALHFRIEFVLLGCVQIFSLALVGDAAVISPGRLNRPSSKVAYVHSADCILQNTPKSHAHPNRGFSARCEKFMNEKIVHEYRKSIKNGKIVPNLDSVVDEEKIFGVARKTDLEILCAPTLGR